MVKDKRLSVSLVCDERQKRDFHCYVLARTIGKCPRGVFCLFFCPCPTGHLPITAYATVHKHLLSGKNTGERISANRITLGEKWSGCIKIQVCWCHKCRRHPGLVTSGYISKWQLLGKGIRGFSLAVTTGSAVRNLPQETFPFLSNLHTKEKYSYCPFSINLHCHTMTFHVLKGLQTGHIIKRVNKIGEEA